MSSKYVAATALAAVTLISSCTSGPTIADVDLAGAPSSNATAPVAPQPASSIVDTLAPNILSTTVARPTQAVATCPVGTHPDRPGPMNQARPTRNMPFLPAALDRESGQVVAIATSGTWAFDVCINTWARMRHSEYLTESLPIVVYDADSDLIVAIQRTVNAYDVDTDTWTNYSKVPGTLSDGAVRGSGVYDPVSGLIVVRSFVTSEMWAYDVETDTWTPLPQGAITPPAKPAFDPGTQPIFEGQVHVYDPDTDRIVLYLIDNSFGRGIWEGAGTEMTWTYDLRSGEWAIEDTVTPELNLGWFLGLEKAAYDETLRTPLVVGDGAVARYDADLHEWDIVWENGGTTSDAGMRLGPLNRVNHTVVYDPTNDRVIVFGGYSRMNGHGTLIGMDDTWVFDGSSGTWTEILASSTS